MYGKIKIPSLDSTRVPKDFPYFFVLYQMSVRLNVRVTKYPVAKCLVTKCLCDKMTVLRNVCVSKCLCDEMTVLRNVCVTKCPCDEMSCDEM